MTKIKELLERIDAEMLAKVDTITAEKDAEIKADAQAAYDASVAASIQAIRDEVDAEYAIARKYLLELLGDTPEVVETTVEAVVEASEAESPKAVE